VRHTFFNDSNFTFDGTTLKVGSSFEIDEQDGDIRTSGSATFGSANVEDLTQGRIVLAGVNGELEDDSDLTFDGTTFKIGNGNFEVDVADGDIRTSGSFTIENGITVNGDLNVTGNTIVDGISANTISATTYQNLPTDIRVTGATYSNNSFTYTNNTGGTYSVLFNTVTGLTVNGQLSVTGNTGLGTSSPSTRLDITSSNITVPGEAKLAFKPAFKP
jgi:hypothetical protein